MAIWTIPQFPSPPLAAKGQGWGGQKGVGRWAVPAPLHTNDLERIRGSPHQTVQVPSVITST